MDANTVTAVCAVVIAVVSLAVSIFQARAARQHNVHSVRPILQLDRGWRVGGRAGLRLVNVGLGPALIVDSTLTVDDTVIGSWQQDDVDRIRKDLSFRPAAVTFNDGEVIAAGYEKYLLSVATYDPKDHQDVERLINRRLTLRIRYESLYGGENFQVTLVPRPPDDD